MRVRVLSDWMEVAERMPDPKKRGRHTTTRRRKGPRKGGRGVVSRLRAGR